METLPDVVIIIDQRREITAIAECRKLGIPIISILDTNCDPDLVDIPIPGNDDAVRSIKLILTSLIKNQFVNECLFCCRTRTVNLWLIVCSYS